MKWSYKTVHFELKKEGLLGGSFLDETEIEEQLNQFGQSGWELISVIEVQNGIICFFRQALMSSTMVYTDRLDDTSNDEIQYEERANDEDQVEPYQDDEGFNDPVTVDTANQSEMLDAHSVEPVAEPEVEVYDVYDDYPEGGTMPPESHEDDIYETVDEVREEIDETNDDIDDKGIGAIRIE